jgi:hypothetical protein
MWRSALTSLGAVLAGGLAPRGSTAAAETAESATAALENLRKSISVDVHTHGGTSGITSRAPPSGDLAKSMRAGSLAVACLADVPDGPVLGRNAKGVLTALRTPAPGELYHYHLNRLDWVDEMVAHHGLRRALSAADLETAHAIGQPSVVGDVKGWIFWRENSSAWKRRIGAASDTSSSCITRRTTSATSRPASLPIMASPPMARRSFVPAIGSALSAMSPMQPRRW